MTARAGRVTRRFFAPPALDVARALIGCELRRDGCAGIIVETEAYQGDEASHFVTRAPSAGALLGDTHGLTYVYVIYGMHLCLNVTANERGPGAVLLRALQPTAGLELMRARRGEAVRDRDLCRGPGRLAQALGVTKAMNGAAFLDVLGLSLPAAAPEIVSGPRVGISRAMELPWRFALRGSPHVSLPRP